MTAFLIAAALSCAAVLLALALAGADDDFDGCDGAEGDE